MFEIERATSTGPRGGKVKGFCLAWRGAGFPPSGRGRRSGWYKFKADALDARRVANGEAARIAARPARPALRMGSPTYVAKLIAPDGGVHWYGPEGDTPDGQEAFRFNNAQAAHGAAWGLFGHGPAFWNSERTSAERARDRFRGWQAEVIADCYLPAPTDGER